MTANLISNTYGVASVTTGKMIPTNVQKCPIQIASLGDLI